MTIASTMDQVCAWLNENVCAKVELKRPPRDGERTGDGYAYERVHPYAFPLYLPTQDKLPPDASGSFPSICVMLDEGRDGAMNREISLTLGFGAWSPGVHPEDWLFPGGGEGERPSYRNAAEGWREIWNFVDQTVTAIESATYMGDLEVVEGVDFAPYKAQEAVADNWPFWFAFCRFKVRSMILRNNKELLPYL